MNTRLSKWGNSLAVRFPKGVVEQAGLKEGEQLELRINDTGEVTLRRVIRKYALEELVANINECNRPVITDWGKPLGREAW